MIQCKPYDLFFGFIYSLFYRRTLVGNDHIAQIIGYILFREICLCGIFEYGLDDQSVIVLAENKSQAIVKWQQIDQSSTTSCAE